MRRANSIQQKASDDNANRVQHLERPSIRVGSNCRSCFRKLLPRLRAVLAGKNVAWVLLRN